MNPTMSGVEFAKSGKDCAQRCSLTQTNQYGVYPGVLLGIDLFVRGNVGETEWKTSGEFQAKLLFSPVSMKPQMSQTTSHNQPTKALKFYTCGFPGAFPKIPRSFPAAHQRFRRTKRPKSPSPRDCSEISTRDSNRDAFPRPPLRDPLPIPPPMHSRSAQLSRSFLEAPPNFSLGVYPQNTSLKPSG